MADSHLTNMLLSNIYVGVVSLKGIRLVLFLAKLNSLELLGIDVGNIYLEAKTKEMIFIIARSEFSPLKNYILIMNKILSV